VVVDGVIVGVLEPGQHGREFPLPAAGRGRRVELLAEPFRAGDGRDLGTLLGHVTLRPAARGFPSPARLALFAAVGAALCALALAAGWTAGAASALGAAAAGVVALASSPAGAVFSPYAVRAAALLGAGGIVAAAAGAPWRGTDPAVRRALFLAVLAAWVVQVILGTSPLLVGSDVVFHANKLAAVAAGDFFPLSVTQHAQPFRFPYGVSFYALLAPLFRLGLDGVALVRAGAALSGVAASVAVFALVLRTSGPRAALAAALLLQLLPGVFDTAFSYGNLSNAFGQAATVLFVAWWVSGRGGWPAGAVLFALGALAHFSSLVVLGAVAVALIALPGPRPDRTRWAALGVGAAIAGLYYAQFLGLVLGQLPRLLEGGGQGRGASRGAWDAARLQVLTAAGQWGLPAVLLAWEGRPRRTAGPAEHALCAFGLGAGLLAIPAVVSPVEVRYVYALTAPLAAAAGVGVVRLHAAGGARRVVGGVLAVAQAALGLSALLHALLVRYRG
jgi:hypothetical protein